MQTVRKLAYKSTYFLNLLYSSRLDFGFHALTRSVNLTLGQEKAQFSDQNNTEIRPRTSAYNDTIMSSREMCKSLRIHWEGIMWR